MNRPTDLKRKLERLSYEIGRADVSGNNRLVKALTIDKTRTEQTLLSLERMHTSTIVNNEKRKYYENR